MKTMLVLPLTMRELCHWPSIADMSPQSHCGDEEDGRIGLLIEHSVCHDPIFVNFFI